MGFDPFNLLLLAIALVVFWKLRSVLGARTGSERPPFDPFRTQPKDTAAGSEPANGNVLKFPKDETSNAPAKGVAEDMLPIWTGYAEAGTSTAAGLEQIHSADPNFSPKAFVDGSKFAYEMIVDAFARGDKQALKPLLSKEVLDGFAAAIDQRQAAGHTIEQRFVGVDKATIAAAILAGRKASITVRFVSELISVTRGRDGAAVDGDPKEIRQTTDVWTFERDTASRDPNWKLVATQEQA